MRFVFCFLLSAVIIGQTTAQSTAFVFQGGPTIGFQRWDNTFDRQPLYQYHGALTIESVNNDDDATSAFLQVGYHVKGSTTRFRFFFQGGGIQTFNEPFKFNNLSTIIGFKLKKPLGEGNRRYYYFGGLRGDYTLSTNIDELGGNSAFAAIYYPQMGGLNRWMFGLSFGGGLQFDFRELVGAQLQLSINPDLTQQYDQPASPPLINPFDPGGPPVIISERRIRNTTLELSVGLRLLRKVEYVDE
jgi:hypothetical protein